VLALLGLGLAPVAMAFNGHKVTEGPLTLTIEPIETVTQLDTPQTVRVTAANAGDAPLEVSLEMKGLVDACWPVGPTERRVTVAPKGNATATFQFTAGQGTYSVHYPVHVYATFPQAGKPVVAHAVQIFQAELPPAPAAATEPAVNVVPRHGALPLATLKNYRVAWNYFDQPLVHLPVGWQGSDPKSSASLTRSSVARGETKQALQMHPPYRPKGGSVYAEYRLKLPPTQPIRLVFANALRDHGPKEPASDGVTFRVWVGKEQLFERHTDAKVWTPGEADLSRFAGREVLLRLESHPGPKRSTTCDSCYWGDPVVIAGLPPAQLSEAEKRQLVEKATAALTSGQADGKSVLVFNLAGGARAVVGLGPYGLADGVLGFAQGDRRVIFDGLRIAILNQQVGAATPIVFAKGLQATQDATGRVRIVQPMSISDAWFDLTTELWTDQAGLRVKVNCPERITDLALGPADQKAPRVYYGHGYCITEPEAFRAGGGGHNLATSHVGFDFQSGLSLLMASDTPPDNLQVDPAERVYTLHTHPESMLTFVPSAKGAFDCALKYRPLYDKKPAGGVARKAGRFVFDYWGGNYADDAAMLKRVFDCGATDSLVIMHNWQRWGYDYRLPDIFPPNPKFGTLEDMQHLAKVCADRGVLFGLHDNYIDFYPDAEGYSYEHITFNEAGQPRKAWINYGRAAQSYQWRPDHIRPFVQRNLALLKASIPQSTYFVDVFTSANSFDYYDRQGKFHSKLETRRCWGEAFALMRETLGNNAPTVSEAGSDHLIGYIDGADCQFMRLGTKPRQFYNRIKCEDWARVPWFDVVNHTRMSLHGVGYSGRYQGGLSRALYGIESDDYISCEMLTGHALMVDLGCKVRGAVRKYWLAQDLIRSLADDEIVGCQFDGDNRHRILVTWKSGAKVYVNRGESDWTVEGRVLPQYGYLATNGRIESSIERIGGAVVEQSRSSKGFFVNGRGYDADPPLKILPTLERVEHVGGRQFKVLVNWDAGKPAAKELTVFMHFYQPQVSRNKLVGFMGGGGKPAQPTTLWNGRVTTGDKWTMTLPEDCPPGEYEILVGLYDPKGKPAKRYRLLGNDDSQLRYCVGTLVVESDKKGITAIRLGEKAEISSLVSRLEPNATPVDFGLAKTLGAFRCEVAAKKLVVTPLPDGAPAKIGLRLDKIVSAPAKVRRIEAVSFDGLKKADVPYQASGSEIGFEIGNDDVTYQIHFE
jgi:hypothetical protein